MGIIKLVLSDIDGTLLDSRRLISKRNREEIAAYIASGGQFALATGRYRNGCKKILEMLGVSESDISCAYDNGAHVVALGETIFDGSIPRGEMFAIVRFLRSLDCAPALYAGSNWAVERRDMFYDKIASVYDGCGVVADFDDVLSDLSGAFSGPVKVAIRAIESKMEGIRESVEREFPQYEYCLSSPTTLEMSRRGMGKDNALRVLAKHFGFGIEQTMAIGDYDNDAGMIAAAGVGVAMANASASALSAATCVTSSNDDDGVARAISKFCHADSQRDLPSKSGSR